MVIRDKATWANITRLLGVALAVQQVYAKYVGQGFDPVIFFAAFAMMGFASVLPPGAKT